MKIKSVVVTGGAGCIGLEVCKELSQRGVEVLLFDLPEQVLRVRKAIPPGVKTFYGSVLDSVSLRDAFEGRDAVVHLAARLGVKRTEENRLACLEINIDGTKNVLDAAVAERLQRVVFASSSEVYGEPARNPVDETVPTSGKTVYAVSKLAGEELCRAYTQRYPWMSHVILRFFNAYGHYQTAQFVVPRFVSSVLHDRSPVIYGEGTQIRSFCFAEDTAIGTVEALLRPEATNEVFNLGNSKEAVSLSELAERVIALAGKEKQLSPLYQTDFNFTDRTKEREILTRYCETSKAESVLGFVPQVSLDDGITRLLESGAIFDRWESRDLQQLNEELTQEISGGASSGGQAPR